MGVKRFEKTGLSIIAHLFLSLFHQVMGVKAVYPLETSGAEAVSIPFSSGHGGKERIRQMILEGRTVSIPFSSGHGGKGSL